MHFLILIYAHDVQAKDNPRSRATATFVAYRARKYPGFVLNETCNGIIDPGLNNNSVWDILRLTTEATS